MHTTHTNTSTHTDTTHGTRTATDPRWPGFNTHPAHWHTLPRRIRDVLQAEATKAGRTGQGPSNSKQGATSQAREQARREHEAAEERAQWEAESARRRSEAKTAARVRKAADLAVSAWSIGSTPEALTAAARAGELARKLGYKATDLAAAFPRFAAIVQLWRAAVAAWSN